MFPLISGALRAKVPCSRARMFSRLGPFDLFWAALSPLLAFLVRDGTIKQFDVVAIYCGTALVVSVVAFQWFKISSPLEAFFSVNEALTVAMACLTTVALTAAILFTFTRLDYAPRSIPLIHFMLAPGRL